MEKEIKTKLENFPNFRERRFRQNYLVKLALRKCGLEQRWEKMNPISLTELADFAIAYDSYRNFWDKVLRENKELQGKDYADKIIYEQQKKIEMGYSPNYHKDVQQLKMI